VAEHKASVTGGFMAQYACKTLEWFEMHDEMAAAIAREKQLKGGSRRKKIELIEAQNPEWRDLYLDLF
jgi:putative endonuclease